MKGICLRYVRDNETANDILQEGFLKVFTNIKQYSGTGSFEGWIKRIFINTALSYIKKHQNKHLALDEMDDVSLYHHSKNEGSEEKQEFDKEDVKNRQINFEVVQSADFSEKELLNVLKNLPDMYRIVFNLYFIENYKHEEIATVLHIDIATSRTRLLRARNIVQKELYEMSLEKLSISLQCKKVVKL